MLMPVCRDPEAPPTRGFSLSGRGRVSFEALSVRVYSRELLRNQQRTTNARGGAAEPSWRRLPEAALQDVWEGCAPRPMAIVARHHLPGSSRRSQVPPSARPALRRRHGIRRFAARHHAGRHQPQRQRLHGLLRLRQRYVAQAEPDPRLHGSLEPALAVRRGQQGTRTRHPHRGVGEARLAPGQRRTTVRRLLRRLHGRQRDQPARPRAGQAVARRNRRDQVAHRRAAHHFPFA